MPDYVFNFMADGIDFGSNDGAGGHTGHIGRTDCPSDDFGGSHFATYWIPNPASAEYTWSVWGYDVEE